MQASTFHSRFHNLNIGLSEPSSPQALKNPQLVKYSPAVAQLMGLPTGEFLSSNLLQVFSGNKIVKNSIPVAQSYAGHQFGKFNPFLGDGRSVLLGEIDADNKAWDVSLKGSGKTPFTFASDGRASLQECLKEYDISEKLAGLGVPVSRCLCVIKGDEQVYRSGFKSAAVLTKITASNIRFGSFENCFFRKDFKALQKLADYVIEHHFSDCYEGENEKNDYAKFFQQVVSKTACLIAQWQNVGFVHGMMNTDNQSIVGITIDLGDSVLLDQPNVEFVASRSDRHGRYAFGQQPVVGLWNCNVLARALSPLISATNLKSALSTYEDIFLEHSRDAS